MRAVAKAHGEATSATAAAIMARLFRRMGRFMGMSRDVK
jgi:hypothetical protein